MNHNTDDPDFDTLLGEPFAHAWASSPPGAAPRQRLMQRLAASLAAEAGMVTVRRRRAAPETLAEGVRAQTLYRADAPALRPGEPRRARLIELAEGATLAPALLGDEAALGACHREWLVLEGRLRRAGSDEPALTALDYHHTPAGHATSGWRAEAPTLLFLRESEQPTRAGDLPSTVRDAEAGWPEFAPGIRRRVLWARDGQAALLYRAEPGAAVPQHRHGHDEECLMVAGELFLDDLLLQRGDYQLAPAGSGHRVTATDTGVVIYAHGDLDLRFVD